ncbi:hypothetical protein ACMD2_17834 [Ananas comosus]|uniref:Uncharacterized protein n=1 Tax=Ananas comosus TaxID=4615 RepID=A0A199UY61_ANACO|nr:hypothetical protein ACMD2_17834 [Ananas comosus]
MIAAAAAAAEAAEPWPSIESTRRASDGASGSPLPNRAGLVARVPPRRVSGYDGFVGTLTRWLERSCDLRLRSSQLPLFLPVV